MDTQLDARTLTPIASRFVHDHNRNLFEPLISTVDAALLLGGIHPKTLQRKARLGEIPGHRLLRAWFFRASELDAYVRSNITLRAANNTRVN